MFDSIRNAGGERLDAAFHAGSSGRTDLVVLGHGVTANKDRAFLVALADALTAKGIAALRFSFAGNGASEGRFVDATVTKEVGDLGAVLDAAREAGFRRLAYAGHSMGGAVGVLRASSDERIELLLSLAGMVHTADFARRKFGALTPGEDCMWDKPECPLSQAFLDDMARIDTVEELAGEVRVPWLLLHGTNDTVVPLGDSLDALAKAPEAELVRLEGADHVFSADDGAELARRAADWVAALWA